MHSRLAGRCGSLALALILYTGAVDAEEMLINPAFEETATNPIGSCSVSGKSISGNVINGWADNSCLTTSPPTTLSYAQDNAPANRHSGAYAQKAVLTSGYMQFRSYPGLALKIGRTYTGSVWLRSNGSMSVTVALQNVNSPWTRYGTKTVTVGNVWTLVSISTTVPADIEGMLVLDTSSPGTLWMDDAAVDDDGKMYVSSNGSGWTCTFAAPCSLTRARDRVRTINPVMTRHLYVYLRGGTYNLTSTFALGSLDSGKEPYRIFYMPYAAEKPVIRGNALGITNWVLYDQPRNIYRATVSMPATRQLYVNGTRAQRARSLFNPVSRDNFFVVSGDNGYTVYDPIVTRMASWPNLNQAEITQLNAWHHYRCPIESVSGNKIIMAQPCWSLVRNATYHGDSTLIMGERAWGESEVYHPFWIENAYEFLDQPGEWYYDVAAATLYYKRRGSEALSAIAPRLQTLVSLTGTPNSPVENITFQGITFEYAAWLGPNWAGVNTTYGYPSLQGGVMLSDVQFEGKLTQRTMPGNISVTQGRRIHFVNNVFQHLGGAAINMAPGCRWSMITGNRFEDISGPAIFFGDGNFPTDSSMHTVENWINHNYIARIGQDYEDSAAINVGYAQSMFIDRNELYDLPYTAISVGSNWFWDESRVPWPGNNKITKNRVQNAVQRARDGGMIYTNGQQGEGSISGRSSEVSENYLISQTFSTSGIYFDHNTAWYTVINNVLSSAPSWLTLQPNPPNVDPDKISVENYNYIDTYACIWDQSRSICLGGNGSDGKGVTDNGSPGAWPAAALSIINNAGIGPLYQNMRNTQVKIEAEAFNHGGRYPEAAYGDTDSQNDGKIYRNDGGVDIWQCPSCPSGYNIGTTRPGEGLAYSVYIDQTGYHNFAFSVASPGQVSPGSSDSGNRLQLVIDSQPGGQTIVVPHTSTYPYWENYQLVPLNGIWLTKGPHILSLVFPQIGNYDFALDYFTYKPQ